MRGYGTNPQIMHETIDGETIVIDLSTGTYYSLRGSGSAIWNAAAAGASHVGIVDGLKNMYEGSPEEIAEATDSFLSELEAEHLIVRETGRDRRPNRSWRHRGPAPPSSRLGSRNTTTCRTSSCSTRCTWSTTRGGRTVLPPGTNRRRPHRTSAATGAPPTTPRTRPDVGVASLFDRAVDRVGLVERHYTIAGLPFTFRFAGEQMLGLVGRAFEHLGADAPSEQGLTVHLWDSESSGTESPPQLGELVETDEIGPMYYYEGDGVQALGRWRTLSVLDSTAGEAWFWTPSTASMASWDWAVPLRAILHWWLGPRGVLQVHAAAIGTPEVGVLVVGRGGSGKSTTALSSLASGLRYAADDLVGVTQTEPRVHSLYCSGKLEGVHLERFSRLPAAVANPVRKEDEKAVVYVDEVFPGSVITGFPLGAVLVPRVVAREPDTRIAPTAPAAALVALAPNSIFTLYPPQATALAEMAALVRSVPCFSLELGSDIARIPDAIIELIGALR